MRPNSYHWNVSFYLQDGKVVRFFYSFSFFSGGYRYQFMHNVCTEPSVQEQINTLDSRLYALGNYVIAATTIPPNGKYTSVQFLLPTSAALHFPFTLLKSAFAMQTGLQMLLVGLWSCSTLSPKDLCVNTLSSLVD